MKINKQYVILEPLQLPWLYVTPTSDNGLEYHLSTKLSVRINGIVSGEDAFVTSHMLAAIDGLEVSELEAEQQYEVEIMPGVTRERVAKTFKTGESSAFFTTRQMEALQQLFESKNYISHDVSVHYDGRRVDDVVELPAKEFDLIKHAFADLHVMATIDYKTSKEEIEEAYEKSIKQNAGKLGDESKKNIWERVTSKGVRKRIGVALGSLLVGVGGLVARQKVQTKQGLAPTLVSIACGLAGIVLEMYGRNELQKIMRLLAVNKREKVVFN